MGLLLVFLGQESEYNLKGFTVGTFFEHYNVVIMSVHRAFSIGSEALSRFMKSFIFSS